MIDTPILAILYEKKIFKNVETSLALSVGQCGMLTIIRYSNFGHIYEKKLPILAI